MGSAGAGASTTPISCRSSSSGTTANQAACDTGRRTSSSSHSRARFLPRQSAPVGLIRRHWTGKTRLVKVIAIAGGVVHTPCPRSKASALRPGLRRESGRSRRNPGGSRPGPGAYGQCPTLPSHVKTDDSNGHSRDRRLLEASQRLANSRHAGSRPERESMVEGAAPQEPRCGRPPRPICPIPVGGARTARQEARGYWMVCCRAQDEGLGGRCGPLIK